MTIEERAKEYALKYDEKYQVAMFKAYIEGATEQKQIDEMHTIFLADAHQQEIKMLTDKVCDLNNQIYRTEYMKKSNQALGVLERMKEKVDKRSMNRTRARMLVAAKLYDAAEYKGISQKQLAELLNKSESEVSDCLSGERNLTIDVIADFESVLEVNILNTAPQYM